LETTAGTTTESLGYVIGKNMDSSALATQIQTVLESDHSPSQRRVFLILDTERDKLANRTDLFGAAVSAAFPSAQADIREAGNCLAAECNTAAVFHLMRVAEVGLRALARDRRVRLPRKEPLDSVAWETIVKELEAAGEAIRHYPKTAAQVAQFAFHHGAISQFAKFKSIFRDQVMHARQQFGPDHALRVFEDVRTFMQALAHRIGENSRTPLVWKGKKWAGN
jgi:hypothetical protein